MSREPLHFDNDDVDVFLASSHSRNKDRSVWSAYLLRGGQTEIRGAIVERETGYAALLIGCIEVLHEIPVKESTTVHCSNTGFLRGVNERLSAWVDSNWTSTDPNTGEERPISNYVRHWEEIARLKDQRNIRFRNGDQVVSEIYIERSKKLARWLLQNSL